MPTGRFTTLTVQGFRGDADAVEIAAFRSISRSLIVTNVKLLIESMVWLSQGGHSVSPSALLNSSSLSTLWSSSTFNSGCSSRNAFEALFAGPVGAVDGLHAASRQTATVRNRLF